MLKITVWSPDQLRTYSFQENGAGLKNQITISFCLKYDPLIAFQRQSHITFIFIKMISHDLLVPIAYNAKNYASTINQKPIITQYKPRLPRNLAKTRALSSFKQDEENREVYLTQRPTSSPGLFPFKMGGAHPFFKGKALGTRLTQ